MTTKPLEGNVSWSCINTGGNSFSICITHSPVQQRWLYNNAGLQRWLYINAGLQRWLCINVDCTLTLVVQQRVIITQCTIQVSEFLLHGRMVFLFVKKG